MRNWYVITGGPSAGKTTLIKALNESGLHVEHESARMVIDEALASGKTIEDVRSDEKAFQDEVYTHKKEREKHLDPSELIFFDRGMQDTGAYLVLHNFPIDVKTQEEMDAAEYKKVFLLEPFKYESDYARTESKEEQDVLFDLLKKAYERSKSKIEIIPAFSTKHERIAYFLDYLREKEGIPIPDKPMI